MRAASVMEDCSADSRFPPHRGAGCHMPDPPDEGHLNVARHHHIDGHTNNFQSIRIIFFVSNFIFNITLDSFTHRTFRELKDYVVSMKSDKDEAPKEGEADVAKVTVLDAKNFDDSIKTGKSEVFNILFRVIPF